MTEIIGPYTKWFDELAPPQLSDIFLLDDLAETFKNEMNGCQSPFKRYSKEPESSMGDIDPSGDVSLDHFFQVVSVENPSWCKKKLRCPGQIAAVDLKQILKPAAVYVLSWKPRDHYMLCSDGVTRDSQILPSKFQNRLNSIESSWYMKMQLLDVVARYLLDVVT